MGIFNKIKKKQEQKKHTKAMLDELRDIIANGDIDKETYRECLEEVFKEENQIKKD